MGAVKKEIRDYFVAVVPRNVDVNDVEEYPKLLVRMKAEAERAIIAQYRGRPPRVLLLDDPEWLVTNSPAEIEKLQPDHDCETCRAGNQRAREYLEAHPDRFMACANLHYTEIWGNRR